MRSLAARHLAELLWADHRFCESQWAYQIALSQTEAQPNPSALTLAAATLGEFRGRLEEIRVKGYCASNQM